MAAAEALRGLRAGGFADWEAAMRFCAAMSLVNGWLVRHGLDVHKALREARMVKKRLPHLFRDYCRICTLSEAARYKKGCGTGGAERQKARAIHERIAGAIPRP